MANWPVLFSISLRKDNNIYKKLAKKLAICPQDYFYDFSFKISIKVYKNLKSYMHAENTYPFMRGKVFIWTLSSIINTLS